MKLSLFLSSVTLIATAILGTSNIAYGQCQGGWCPIPNAYYNQNAPSKYGYDQNQNQNQNTQNYQSSNWQGNQNPNWQGNQNPNWQGNQNPNWRNDQGWRGGSNAGYYQTSSSDMMSNSNISDNASMTYSPSQGIINDKAAGNLNSSDKLLQHRIEDALKNNYLKKNFNLVTVRVYNGNVTLGGSVDTIDDRLEVEKRVQDLQGVRNINNQMSVGAANQTSYNWPNYNDDTADTYSSNPDLASSSATSTDQDLQKLADDALKNNYVKKNFDLVVVTVSNGIVTISGIIESDKDRQDILDRLKRIKGITSINDRLQVTGTKTGYNYYKNSSYTR